MQDTWTKLMFSACKCKHLNVCKHFKMQIHTGVGLHVANICAYVVLTQRVVWDRKCMHCESSTQSLNWLKHAAKTMLSQQCVSDRPKGVWTYQTSLECSAWHNTLKASAVSTLLIWWWGVATSWRAFAPKSALKPSCVKFVIETAIHFNWVGVLDQVKGSSKR